jgi:RHS repeat-associated protein
MTAAPSTTYTNDLVGNRSSETASSITTCYTWDVMNRMTGRSNSFVAGTYTYRSDGLRTRKSVVTSTATTVDDFRYDGQMPFENESLSGTTLKATRSALGARGVDAEESLTGTYNVSTGARTLGTATISYPLYDAHGNRVSSLSRSGTNGFTYDPVRFYGAWGEVRVGATTGGSIWRYCANLGHVQDDESGLVYMRARYYEPTSGRFINEDSAMHGGNWYAYCANNPINQIDKTGNFGVADFISLLHNLENVTAIAAWMGAGVCFAFAAFLAMSDRTVGVTMAVGAAMTGVALLMVAAGMGSLTNSVAFGLEAWLAKLEFDLTRAFQ